MLDTWLFIFELIMLALTGRQVVQYDADPNACAAWFPAFFLLGDLVAGHLFFPSLAGRLVSAGLLFLHFHGLKRLKGVLWLAALLFGACIPFFVGKMALEFAGG